MSSGGPRSLWRRAVCLGGSGVGGVEFSAQCADLAGRKLVWYNQPGPYDPG